MYIIYTFSLAKQLPQELKLQCYAHLLVLGVNLLHLQTYFQLKRHRIGLLVFISCTAQDESTVMVARHFLLRIIFLSHFCLFCKQV